MTEVCLKTGKYALTPEEISTRLWNVCGLEIDPATIRTAPNSTIYFLPLTSAALADFLQRNLNETYEEMHFREVGKPKSVRRSSASFEFTKC